jgi:inward rectifier potassium channel
MSRKKIFQQDAFRETGFGSRIEGTQRLMNKDGGSNVLRTGSDSPSITRVYHALIAMKWSRFISLMISAYLIVNLLFATAYFMIDAAHIGGMQYHSNFEQFMEIFYFSAQSLTTVGYGRLNPTGILDSSIATIESFVGLLGFALATGLLYGRFSRPVASVLFSYNAVIAPFQGITGLMIRIANKSKSELIDVDATLVMAYIDNDTRVRKFSNLKLELTKITFLSMSWTIVHPIDEESPMNGWTEEDLNKKNVEILVIIRGYEETFSQNVQARSSYNYGEIVYGAKFLPMTKAKEDGSVTIDLRMINDHLPMPLFEEVPVTSEQL